MHSSPWCTARGSRVAALLSASEHALGLVPSLSVKRTRTLGPPSRALRYLPVSTLILDLLVMTSVFALAVLGRNRLDIDDPADVTSSLQVRRDRSSCWRGWSSSPSFGGYRDEHLRRRDRQLKRVFNASLVTAGLVGVGCYMAKFQRLRALPTRVRHWRPRPTDRPMGTTFSGAPSTRRRRRGGSSIAC